MLYLPILTIFIAFTHGCISFGDDQVDEKRALELRTKKADSLLNEQFIETYLKTFGYFRDSPDVPELERMKTKKEKLEIALKSFQEFMAIPSTGIMDTASSVTMMRKRCSNPDKFKQSEMNVFEKKSFLTYNITTFPEGMKQSEFRQLLSQAIAGWEIVIPMDFIEVGESERADIVFSFVDPLDGWINDPTHLSIAGSSDAPRARIWISRDEAWGTNTELDQRNTDLFNVIAHELGHALGLRHSSDPNSVMYPLFERDIDQVRPEVTSDDVEKLRNLYNVDVDTEVNSEADVSEKSPQGIIGGRSSKCPLTLQAVTRVPNGELLIFKNDKVWKALKTSIVTGAVEVAELFPSGPSYVNTSSTVGSLIVLISDRKIYSYIQNENSEFSLAQGYPKELHGRVLFYPEAAFPLANGSLILLSDDVFAIYDLEQNAPTMLNDKTVYFPNLPEELKSGIPEIPGSDEIYQMFTADTVYEYDFRIQQIVNSQPLTTYLTCDL